MEIKLNFELIIEPINKQYYSALRNMSSRVTESRTNKFLTKKQNPLQLYAKIHPMDRISLMIEDEDAIDILYLYRQAYIESKKLNKDRKQKHKKKKHI
jgi:hypothetical protein